MTRFLAVFSVLAALLVWLPGVANAAGGPALVGCTTPSSLPCTQSSDYSGGLQSGWSELDWVPYRFTIPAGTSSAMYQLGGDHYDVNPVTGPAHVGFDNVSAPTFVGGCTGTSYTATSLVPGGTGGSYDVIVRNITAAAGATDCVIGFQLHLAIGASQYSGASLSARWMNGGHANVPLKVSAIQPQQAALTANAATTPSYTWTLGTSGATQGVTINSCLPAPTTANATYTVSYTRTLVPGAVSTVTGNLTLTNPAHVPLYYSAALTVKDSTSSTVGTGTVGDGGTPVPAATSSGPGTVTKAYSIPTSASTGTLTVSATVTYYDDAAHTDNLGSLSTSASATVSQSQNPAVGGTAGVQDAESTTGNIVFKRTAPDAMTSFATSNTFTQSESDSGSFTVNKIIAAAAPGNFTGSLSNVVTLTPSSGGSVTSGSPATVNIPVTVTAADPTIQITKTVDIAPTGTPATFAFTIKSNDNPAQTWTQSVTIPVGATSGTAAAALSVAPSATGYTISETPDPRYSAATPTTTGSGSYCQALTPQVSNSAITPTPVASLALSKAVDKATAALGDTLTYTLTVVASGNENQTNVVVSDILPGYNSAETSGTTTYVATSARCTVTCATAYDPATHTVTWTIATMAPGATAGVSYQVTIDRPTAAADGSIPPITIRNVGAVRSTQAPSTPSNVVTTTTTAVLGLTVTKPPAATPAAAKPAAVLPFTGSGLPLGPASIVAVMLIGLGLGMSATRRRPNVRGRGRHLRLS